MLKALKEKLTNSFGIFLVLLVATASVTPLLRSGYFPMHDDMQAMRVYEMNECIKDGQIPCRWVPNMGYGYGYPQFNFYGPTPYYLMEAFHLVGLSILTSVKVGFIIATFTSGIGMYLLGSALWGSVGGLVASTFYIYAPYRLVNFYVRGAVGELFAMAIIPFIFWSILKIYEGNKRAILYLAVSFSLLLTTHNISTLMYAPFIVFWLIYLSYQNKLLNKNLLKSKTHWHLVGGFTWGLILSAFFFLPNAFESKFVHIETLTQGYFNYLAHFLSIKQALFSTYWDYGGSEYGIYDTMMLGIGVLHFIIPLTFLMGALVTKSKHIKTLTLFLLLSLVAIFMTHSKSTFLWEFIGVLKFVQFPWRFLSVSTFFLSLSVGFIGVVVANSKTNFLIMFISLILIILFYHPYSRPKDWIHISDAEKFSGDSWQKQLTISIFDYLPIYAKMPPGTESPHTPVFQDGSAQTVSGKLGTDWQRWEVEVSSNSVKVIFPTYYFPGFEVYVNGNKSDIDYNNDLGLIAVHLSKGKNVVEVKMTNTPIRNGGNVLSFIGLLAIPYVLIKKYV